MRESLEKPGSISTLYDSLAHQRRQYVLCRLREAAKPLQLADLAEDVAAKELHAPKDELPAEKVNNVQVDLYHSHIPKLADADLIRYDTERRLVELLEFPDELQAVTQSKFRLTKHRIADSQTPSTAVKQCIAELEECDPSQLGTLAHAVDVDELDDFVEGHTAKNDTSQSITFAYCGYVLKLYSDGTLLIRT